MPNDKWLIHYGNDSSTKNKSISNENDKAEEKSYEIYDEDNDDDDDDDDHSNGDDDNNS